MAIIKCKMCGGDLILSEDANIATCEFCGSVQTVPSADNEKKLTLFARANRLRAACEFDKAAGIYETIVADFPEEAEAYWGLVLCKYGIEYVDDPGTGKKIPTCHRSSFDSVMDDSNFEQAMENAEEAALRVYRQEAKQIEGIRRGILEVSSNERPYDIFICYKETDSRGDRTVDSLLAQDIYDALTAKGYRTFFARISLEDKLGQAYEPYIFAALNSAKIMLAVGTCYEHYNAVWVKNEWSRYLKIIAQDKNKYLIPCYKSIDAYDIPKEFAHLQGQDMGKIGAIQDLLRGIDKLMPKQKNTTVIQERVVVGGPENNKIASLLDRGNMALEDGDWEKADSFFEDVLNNDSKNAQAYIGKTLAQEKCRTMDALIRKRVNVYQKIYPENVYLKAQDAHIKEMAEQYELPGYVDSGTIRALYRYNLHYASEVAGRQRQYRDEELWWQNHKLLARAEKFAFGAVSDHLQNEKKRLFSQLADRVKKAQAADEVAAANLAAAYEAHIAEADKKAEQIYNEAIARREQNYQSWLNRAKEATDPDLLLELAEAFADLGSYKDSQDLAEHCRKRAADETDNIRVQKEQQRQLQSQNRKKRWKKVKRTFTTIVVTAVILAVAAGLFAMPLVDYLHALVLTQKEQYEEACAIYVTLDGYLDSEERLAFCEQTILEEKYQTACELYNAESYRDALAAFEELGDYKASAAYIKVCKNAIRGNMQQRAYRYMEKDLYKSAMLMFVENIDHDDSVFDILRCSEHIPDVLDKRREVGLAAMTLYKRGNPQKAMEAWDTIAVRDTVSTSYNYTVAVKNDGTVVAVGSNSKWDDTMVFLNGGPCDVYGWRDIVAVATGSMHTVGLKKDGTVVATGCNDNGQCNVSDWTEIVSIAAGEWFTLGLKADGTVVCAGKHEFLRDVGNIVTEWENIVAIAAGTNDVVGLKADGTVVGTFTINGNHEDLVDVDLGHTGGLPYFVGQKEDRSIVISSENAVTLNALLPITQWKDIVSVRVELGRIVGIRKGRTVICAEASSQYEQFESLDLSHWKDIVAVSPGYRFIVGLKSNGTMVAAGENVSGQCNVTGWRDIKTP